MRKKMCWGLFAISMIFCQRQALGQSMIDPQVKEII